MEDVSGQSSGEDIVGTLLEMMCAGPFGQNYSRECHYCLQPVQDLL